jgi:hypothetical protein
MISGGACIAVGVWFLLIGFGKTAVSKNPEVNAAFLQKWSRFFQIGGAIIIAAGIIDPMQAL